MCFTKRKACREKGLRSSRGKLFRSSENSKDLQGTQFFLSKDVIQNLISSSFLINGTQIFIYLFFFWKKTCIILWNGTIAGDEFCREFSGWRYSFYLHKRSQTFCCKKNCKILVKRGADPLVQKDWNPLGK